MKNKYGFKVTMLTKAQREIIEQKIGCLNNMIDKAVADHESNQICYSEYNSIIGACSCELAGIQHIIALLGWKYYYGTGKLVPRNKGYEDMVTRLSESAA